MITFNQEGNFYISILENQIFLIASTYDASLKNDKNVIKKLKNIDYKGQVFVDMLLKNGNISTRFLSVFFDGNSFNKSKILEDRNKFLSIEKDFYKNHPQIVENSILSRSEKWDLLDK